MAVALTESKHPRPHGAGELLHSKFSCQNMNKDSLWVADRWRPSVVESKESSNAASRPSPQSDMQQIRDQEQQHSLHSRFPRPEDPPAMGTQRIATPTNIQQQKTNRPLGLESSRLAQPFPAAFSHTSHDDRNDPNYHQPETHVGSWRSLQDDRCTSSSHVASAPQLTLHIPRPVSDLPRIATGPKPEDRSYGELKPEISTPTTSLPSFATLRQQTNPAHDDGPERETAAPSSRLSSYPGIQQQSQHRLPPATSIQNLSPPSSLKRPREAWEHEDVLSLKRPRSGASAELPFPLPVYGPREDGRTSIDFSNGREPPGRAPSLPPPPSYGYPPSAAPTLPPPTVASNGSPANSYHPTVSIHTTSTNSATSSHMADLQHQVTLKSLAMQTLQSEYASLLQKFQRERIKSQAIEKKTTVADQEVNDLTGKNEDLMDRVRELELQLEECEKKREAERAEAARDKEQWGRMLDMSGRLHAKIVDERQKLFDERAALQERIARLSGSESPRPATPSETHVNAKLQHPETGESSCGHDLARLDFPSTVRTGRELDEVVSLRREVKSLHARIATLRLTLETARLNSREVELKSREIEASIGRCLQEDEQQGAFRHQAISEQQVLAATRLPSNRSTPGREKPAWELPRTAAAVATQASLLQRPSQGTFEYISNGKTSTAIIADVARAKSPGPEELGIHVVPSTASPEELIKALGPVPAAAISSERRSPAMIDERRIDSTQVPQDGSGHVDDQPRFTKSSQRPGHSSSERSSPRRQDNQSLSGDVASSQSELDGIKSTADQRPHGSDSGSSSSIPATHTGMAPGQQDWMRPPAPAPPRPLELLSHVQA